MPGSEALVSKPSLRGLASLVSEPNTSVTSADVYHSLEAAFSAVMDIPESWKALREIKSAAVLRDHDARILWSSEQLERILMKPMALTAATSQCFVDMLCSKPEPLWLREKYDSVVVL